MATKKNNSNITSTTKGYDVTSYDDWKSNIQNTINSDADYQAAKEKLASTEANKPSYAGTYDQDVADAYKKILNREGFQYNLDDDALYKQYADKYMSAGKLAMKNSMGQSAALTGGYGSSYGAAVGQQTYDSYLQNLSDVALDMYDRAYTRYKDQGDQLKDNYSLAADMAGTEYSRYADALSQFNTDRSFDYGALTDAYTNAYNRDNEAYSRYTNDEEFAYNYATKLAEYGDFSLMEQLFGKDAANNAKNTWAMSNPDAAYSRGIISAGQYHDLTGNWPYGYDPWAGEASSSGSGSSKKGKMTGVVDSTDYTAPWLLEMNYQEAQQKSAAGNQQARENAIKKALQYNQTHK